VCRRPTTKIYLDHVLCRHDRRRGILSQKTSSAYTLENIKSTWKSEDWAKIKRLGKGRGEAKDA